MYKVGDKITIRKDLEVGQYGCDKVLEEMLQYRGMSATIEEVNKALGGYEYGLKEMPDYWFTEEMFEPVSKVIIEGDKLTAIINGEECYAYINKSEGYYNGKEEALLLCFAHYLNIYNEDIERLVNEAEVK